MTDTNLAPAKSPTRFILTYILLMVGTALFFPLGIVLVIVAYRDIARAVRISRLVREARPEVEYLEHLNAITERGNFKL